jgi:hypothetical protein
LAEQLQEVRAEWEELVNVERVLNRPTDAFSGVARGLAAMRRLRWVSRWPD